MAAHPLRLAGTVVQVSENHSRQKKAGVYGNQKKYKEAIGREEISFVSIKLEARAQEVRQHAFARHPEQSEKGCG